MNKDIESFNDNGQRHGYWEMYFNGKLWYNCLYYNDKEVGYEEGYHMHFNGKLREKIYHI
jgi:antitoxin component YwqK of YwqJK toxin-antitoxin module